MCDDGSSTPTSGEKVHAGQRVVSVEAKIGEEFLSNFILPQYYSLFRVTDPQLYSLY